MILRPESPAGRENTSSIGSLSATGREVLGKLSLDINGFVLTEHETASRTFTIPMRSSPFATPRSSAC